MEGVLWLLATLYLFVFSILRTTAAVGTLSPSQALKDGETIVSADGSFELGFFSPTESSTSRFLGIWYKKVSYGTVVWVANRGTPISDKNGVLLFSNHGILSLLNSTNSTVWSSNASRTAEEPVALLLNSGNLVVRDGKDKNPAEENLWQSFDYPCDTILPGMKIGKNLVTGFERFLSSWRSTDDPAPGQYFIRMYISGYPQLILEKGSKIKERGAWNGVGISGITRKISRVIRTKFVLNENEVYFTSELINSSVFFRYILNPSGLGQRLIWSDQTHDWQFLAMSFDRCDNYALCGTYSSCSENGSPAVCSCLEGFMPKSNGKWDSGDWSDGCVRRTPLTCNNEEEGFLKRSGLKLPDTSRSKVTKTMDIKDCRQLCLRNCSCTAYTNLDIRGGSGCLLWFGELIDMSDIEEDGQDLYIRLAASEIANVIHQTQSREKKRLVIVVGSVVIGMGMLILPILCILWRKGNKEGLLARKKHIKDSDEEMELPLFSLGTIANATSNFSPENLLGRGGFGPVYKGTLVEGQDIAVKRLSKDSGQGLNEFKNEVLLIAKLQHRNLVKLLGCCIHGDEKLLIYEYMPNKSLDYFIFDQTRSKLLDWHKRLIIIGGIARGLLYLHQDSRLRIIHRDLKSANILLDNAMNPKISDFGLARAFLGEQTETNTNRVVGTYGYMSPEYAIDGIFSVKSDVFSFGVLVLEIVSGKKNRGFCNPDHDHNLLGHAWTLWTERRPMELIDDALRDFSLPSEVQRCIHIGLLCVQQRPEDRPNMSSVILMLGSETALPQPKQPGFFTGRNLPEAESSSSNRKSSSENECSITLLEAR